MSETVPASTDAPAVRPDLARLEALIERLADLAKRPEVLSGRAPSVSGWSVGEHVMHATLAVDLSLGNALALGRGDSPRIRAPQPRSPEADDVLRRGRIPRGVAEAPRFVRPPARIAHEVLHGLIEDCRRAVTTARELEQELAAAPGAIAHQLLGDLRADEWLRFARLHTAHHVRILREVLASTRT